MTKIDQISPQTPDQLPGSKTGRTTSDGASFADALKKAEAQAAETGQPQAANQAAAPTQAAEAAAPAAPQPIGPAQRAGVEAGEKALSSLEQYQQALTDQSQSLKVLEPLVRKMERDTESLYQAMEQLNPEDELHGLLHEIGATAEAEAIKFNRGDLVPAAPVEA